MAARGSAKKTPQPRKRTERPKVRVTVDRQTGFTLVNGVTLVCVMNGGGPMSR